MPWASTGCLQTPTAALRILRVLSLLVSSQHEQKMTNINSPLVHSAFVLVFFLSYSAIHYAFNSTPKDSTVENNSGHSGRSIFPWMDWHSDSCWGSECHRTLQTTMDKPSVLEARDQQQLSFLKKKPMRCLNPAVFLPSGWALSLSYERTAASIKDLGNSSVLHSLSCSPQWEGSEDLFEAVLYL